MTLGKFSAPHRDREDVYINVSEGFSSVVSDVKRQSIYHSYKVGEFSSNIMSNNAQISPKDGIFFLILH